MLRSTLVAVLISLSACATVGDGWKRYPFIGGHFDLNLGAVHGEPLKRSTIRMVLDRPRKDEATGQEYDSGVIVQDHDCSADRFRVVDASFFNGAAAISTPRKTTGWLPPNQIHRDICARPGQ